MWYKNFLTTPWVCLCLYSFIHSTISKWLQQTIIDVIGANLFSRGTCSFCPPPPPQDPPMHWVWISLHDSSKFLQNLPREAAPVIEDKEPPSEWPDQGRIAFQDVKMRYRDNLPLVLRGVSFSVRPKEKVGIIGRTGSGKNVWTYM